MEMAKPIVKATWVWQSGRKSSAQPFDNIFQPHIE